MKGKLYGIGVGPGDPELMTLKAVRTIEESDIVVVPGKQKEDSVAYQIALPVCPSMKEKEIIALPMPMTKDKKVLEENYNKAANTIAEYLEKGKQVSFLTLGDATIYATYLYVHQRIVEKGYETEIISGIPSFCAVAAKLNVGLVERAEMLHVIPASYQISDALHLSGTKVLMKAASKMKDVKAELVAMDAEAMMIENCGMANEKIYRSTEEMPEESSYYSLIIVK